MPGSAPEPDGTSDTPRLARLRGDERAGAITFAAGLSTAIFATFVMLFIALHREATSAMGARELPPDVYDAYLFKLLPWLIIIGVALAAAGHQIRGGSTLCRRLAQAVCVASLGWLAVAFIDGFRLFPQLAPASLGPNPALTTACRWICCVGGAILYASFPTALLLVLRFPAGQHSPNA